MTPIKIRGIILLLGLCVALNLVQPSYSAESDFAVAPSRVDLMIKPSQKVSMHFNLTNYGDPHTFIPRFASGAPDSTGGTLQLSKTTRTPVSFTFANGRRDVGDPVFLKTNESANIPVTLETVGGEEKDYYYFFLAEVQPAGAREGKTSAQLSPRIGVPVVVSLTNTGDRELKSAISVFRIKADYSFNLFGREITLVESGSAVPVYLSVSNLGSNFISPQGKITMKGSFGAGAEYPVMRRNIYAQSARLMLTPSSYERYCPGKDECKRFSLLLKGLLIGKYDLTASMDLGTDASKSFKTITFIAFPFKPVLTAILFICIYMMFHKWQGRHKRHAHSHHSTGK